MRPVLLVLLLAAGPLAGCAALDLDSLRPPAAEARALPWGLTDCQFAVAVLPAAPEKVRAFLPRGFEPLSFSEIGLPPDPRGGANVGVELWTCQDGVGLNGTTGPVAYGATFTFVEPPPNLVVNGSAFHFYKWDTLVVDEGLRMLLEEAEAPVYAGSGSFSQFQSLPQGGFSGTLDMNGTYAFQGSLVAPADEAFRAFNFTEFTQTEDGFVWWNVTVDAPQAASGTGRVTLPGGILQTILGSGNAQAYFLGGTASFPNATVTLPPRLPEN